MIVDNISNISLYIGLNPNLVRGLDFLTKTDLDSLAPGRYEIDGEKVYASVSEYNTRNLSEGKWEAHIRYTDIQFLISGTEKIGYAPVDEQKIITAYDAEKDILFLEGTGDFISMKKGTFVILTPNDAHMPCIMNEESKPVKKIVIKALFEDYL